MSQKRMDVLSGNLANINSIGFKRRNIDFLSCRDVAITNLEKNSVVGQNSSGFIVEDLNIDLKSGTLKYTGNPLDFAINGKNFFVVEDENGNQLLTKNGSFKIDSENFLVNQDGFRVLGENGYIEITDSNNLSIDSEGYIYIDEQQIDKFNIVSVTNSSDLFITNSSYYTLREGAENQLEENINIKQNYLEVSNVNGVGEMVEMISIMRSYEANQKALRVQNETLSKAVNQVGDTNV